ncbi:MAG: lysophospholipid acyltransferase family protein [Chloroflexota bacterium]
MPAELPAQTAYQAAPANRIFRALFRPAFRGVFHLLSRVTVAGLENVPTAGAYLMAVNHVSIFEPPLVLSFWPTAPEAAGAVEIWSKPGQNVLAKLYGGIQVHRGEYDRQLVEVMLRVLGSGRPLLLAPEGGRSHTPGMRRAQPGVAYLADQAQAPVVPVGVTGATDDFLARALRGERPAVTMRVGPPFRLPPIEGRGEARRLARQNNADRIMLHIARLLPPEYHGVYAGQALQDMEGQP